MDRTGSLFKEASKARVKVAANFTAKYSILKASGCAALR